MWSDIRREDFALPTLATDIREWAQQINHGRGFLLVKELPVERNNDQVRSIFWGIGLHVGVPLSQNSYGEMLGDVYDEGVKMGTGRVRGYRTNQQLRFHTDRCDIVGLLCLQEARSGGVSSIVSSTTIYNEIARNHPENYRPCTTATFMQRWRKAARSRRIVSPSMTLSTVSSVARILRNTIENARKMGYAQYTELETAALAYMDSLAHRPDLRLDMALERGDMQFINNYTTLHARTEFEDFPEPQRRRHMVRLWLKANDARRRVSPEKFTDYHGVEKTLERGDALQTAPAVHG